MLGHAARHAGTLYGRMFRWLLSPLHKIEAEAEHLHQVEHAGEEGETPAIAMFGVFLFLLPIFLIMLGLALLAAHLAG